MLFIILSPRLMAQNPFLFKPDFSGQSVFMPKGTNLVPLCSDPSSPLCFNQWTNQAIPLSSYFPNLSVPQYGYFLPSFIPSGFAENPENDTTWEEIYIPAFSSSSRRQRGSKRDSVEDSKEADNKTQRSFYRNKSKPNQIRLVETDSEGEVTVQEGQVAFVSLDDIEPVAEAQPSITSHLSQRNPPHRPVEIQKDSPQESSDQRNPPHQPVEIQKDSPRESSDQRNPPHRPVEIQKDSPQESSDQRNPPHRPVEIQKDSPQESSDQRNPPHRPVEIQKDSPQESSPLQHSSPTGQDFQFFGDTYQISRDTYVLSSTTKEVEPGCFIIDKQEVETEAGFCPECVRSEENNSILPSLVQNQEFFASLQSYLKKVVMSSEDKIEKQTANTELETQKICSPEISLQAIIDNFESTCPSPYRNNFESFFKRVYCQSCQKGIPVELMMGMMSIESAGRCSAVAQNTLESSAGLFQIDASQHDCRDEANILYRKNTRDNLQCLKNPVNNLNSAVDILTKHYEQVNPHSVSEGQCKDWLDINSTERDFWRRAVSAYNGGPGWVTRAIKSARDTRTLSDTRYLQGAHRQTHTAEKNDTARWEELRLFYFIEKLSQKNRNLPKCNSFLERDQGGTGRQLCLTVSNLAHTEAVLGREVKNSTPGMVEIWGQYKKQFLQKHPVTCP